MRTSSIGERIAKIRGGESQVDAAKRFGVHKTSWGRYERNERDPDAEVLIALSKAGWNPTWILLGEGPEKLGALQNFVAENRAEYSESDFAKVPLFDVTASAGYGALSDEYAGYKTLSFRKEWLINQGLTEGKLAALEVSGDSMMPTLASGDTVLIDRKNIQPIVDAIYVIVVDGLLMAKRLQLTGDGLLVTSDNPVYKGFKVSANDDLVVIGKVVWAGRSMR